jgi:hypothetical protein
MSPKLHVILRLQEPPGENDELGRRSLQIVEPFDATDLWGGQGADLQRQSRAAARQTKRRPRRLISSARCGLGTLTSCRGVLSWGRR